MQEEIKKLFVGHLDWNTTLDDLVTEFSTAGEVDTESPDTKLMTKTDEANPDRILSRGFAFVMMKTVDDAKKVIAKYNGYKLGNMNITVDFARPQAPRRPFEGGNRTGGGFNRGGNSGGYNNNRSGGGFNRGGDRGGNRSGGGFNRGRSSYDNDDSDYSA